MRKVWIGEKKNGNRKGLENVTGKGVEVKKTRKRERGGGEGCMIV